MQKENAEKNRKTEEQERKKRRDDMKRKNMFLECAFEGNTKELVALLDEVMVMFGMRYYLWAGWGWEVVTLLY